MPSIFRNHPVRSEKKDRYDLCSSDIDALESSANLGQDADGLVSVLHLLSPTFQAQRADEKVRVGLTAVLSILNGIIRLKYKTSGLTRDFTISPRQVRPGISSRKDEQGRVIYTKSVGVSSRVPVTIGEGVLLAADRQSPTAMEIWRLARSRPPIARALYFYGIAHEDDTTNLRKVVEEIMADTYSGSRKPNFKEWKEQWPKNVVGQSKTEELWEWLNNANVTGDKAAHSPAASYPQSPNVSILTSEALDIIHVLLMRWVEEKYAQPKYLPLRYNAKSATRPNSPFVLMPCILFSTTLQCIASA